MKFLEYIQGHRSGVEANEIEKQSLSDPFLADAIDGYDSIEGNHLLHIIDMQTKIQSEKMPSKAQRVRRIVSVVAVLVIVVSGYFYISEEKNYSNLMSYMSSGSEQGYDESHIRSSTELMLDRHDGLLSADVSMSDTSDNREIEKQLIDNTVKGVFTVSEDDNLSENQQREISDQESIANSSSKSQGGSSVSNESKIASEEKSIQGRSKKNSDRADNQAVVPSSNAQRTIYSEKSTLSQKASANIADASDVQAKAYQELSEDADNSYSAQNDDKGNIISEQSVPVIGYKKYKKYLKKNIKYPHDGKCFNVTGNVILEFNVTKTGRPINIEVIQSLCSDLDIEALRLIRKGSNWTVSDKRVQCAVEFVGEKKD